MTYESGIADSTLPISHLCRSSARRRRTQRALLAAVTALVLEASNAGSQSDNSLWRAVEIVRTAHGVPHIRAESMFASGYALAWLQLEDHGPRTALNVLRA